MDFLTSAALEPRSLWSTAPPEPRTKEQNWPTLLYSWWATSFAAVIILVRLNGRKVRSGRLFKEDWIMFFALLPLFIRMIFVHFVLIYGTNNVQTIDYTFTDQQLYQRSIGARLVLAARIFYAAFIWLSKWTVSEFLKRMTISLWRRSYEMTLRFIRGFLVATFIVVVIATLTECQPFDHYWQVVPDPGPQCRQGFAQLLAMGTADIITDILLIVFPIPIVLRSGQHWSRKLLLTCLFSTSIVLIIITGFRMPEVIKEAGRQQYRTVWASSEIVASTFVSNFVIIGSFLRDKGTKKNKYRATSVTDSLDRPSTRRPTIVALQSLGSDEELFRTLGCRLPEHLQDPKDDKLAFPEPVTIDSHKPHIDLSQINAARDREFADEIKRGYDDDSSDKSTDKPVIGQVLPSPAPSSITKRNVSFFDVGGILESGRDRSLDAPSQESTLVHSSGDDLQTIARDWAPPSPSHTRRSSRQDNFSAMAARIEADIESRRNSPQPPQFRPPPQTSQNNSDSGYPIHGHSTHQRPLESDALSLQDAGGLLSEATVTDASPNTSSTSPPSRPPQLRGELQDLGGLLTSNNRPMDASAAALQRRMQRARNPNSPPASPPRTNRASFGQQGGAGQQGGGMTLSDPGGLLK